MKKFSYILILFSLFCYAGDKYELDLNDSKTKYYYCAIFEEGGLRLETLNEIDSINDFKEKRLILNKVLLQEASTIVDAIYYKVVKENNLIIVYGYSMLTGKLRELMKTDSDEKLIYKKIFMNSKKNKECRYQYHFKDDNLVVEEVCNKELTLMRYKYNQPLDYYEIISKSYFKKDDLLKKDIYDTKEGTVTTYNSKGEILEKGNFIDLADLCVPYMPYYEKSK